MKHSEYKGVKTLYKDGKPIDYKTSDGRHFRNREYAYGIQEVLNNVSNDKPGGQAKYTVNGVPITLVNDNGELKYSVTINGNLRTYRSEAEAIKAFKDAALNPSAIANAQARKDAQAAGMSSVRTPPTPKASANAQAMKDAQAAGISSAKIPTPKPESNAQAMKDAKSAGTGQK